MPTPPSDRIRQAVWPVVGAILFLVALALIRKELSQYTFDNLRAAIRALPPSTFALGIALTVVNYVLLTGYDSLGLRYIGSTMARGRVVFASTIGYAFSQALGFPLLTGAPIRYRLYSQWGLGAVDIAKVVAFCSLTFWLGFAALGGTVLVLTPIDLPDQLGLSTHLSRPLGGVLLAVVAAYLAWCAKDRGPVTIRGKVFSTPTLRLAGMQIGLGATEWLVSGSVLWAFMPPEAGLGLGETLSLFAVAQFVGLVSHVPGGVGVFEAVVLLYLPPSVPEHQVLAALLAYRVIYYVLPLLVAAVALGVSEARANRRAAGDLAASTMGAVSALAPRAIAALTFLTGTILVVSGVVPVPATTRRWLAGVLPLPLFELSHFAASLVGAALLVLARGLQRRLDGAYHVTLAATLLGTLLAVARGFGPAELLPLVVLLGVLFASRGEFHRRASLLAEPFTTGWVVAIGLVLVTSIWLGTFAYARLEYSSELWWTFAFAGNAPRFLRSTVGVAAFLGLFAVARLLRPAPAVHVDADPAALEAVAPIVAASPRINAHLALLGDKQIMMAESGRSFIMYGIEGNSWVAMGDPVGEPDDFGDLARGFRDRADAAGDAAVFYQITPDHLPIYLDLGLGLLKLGEEAFVELDGYTFDGTRRADFRKALRRVEEAKGTFEVVPIEGVPAIVDELEWISDAWLESRNVTEKGFSLGAFRRRYLCRTPVAVVRVEGRAVAFGNLWISAAGDISFDLIRYLPNAPRSTMDYLFAQLIVWGREHGYRRMGLGMAPLSGLGSDPLAPLWHRLGTRVFRYGGHFYNFQGLRAYKEKFDPVWEPRYLASPTGLALPRVLTDVTSLIAGGLGGIVGK